MVTKQSVANKLLSYLQHQTTLAELVDWAENALLEADFPEADKELLTGILARLGLADAHTFGLAWEDCEAMVKELGFSLSVQMQELV